MKITASSPSLLPVAQAWATAFGFEVVTSDAVSGWSLRVTDVHLELFSATKKQFAPVWVDFLQGKLSTRLRSSQGGRELLVRAVGVKSAYRPRVLDVTAGWGRDAFVLMTAGCEVMMLERDPMMAALLQDGLTRWSACVPAEEHSKLSLVFSEATHYLTQLTVLPDVIYLDPMYPVRHKSARVKKEMQILQEIMGYQQDVDVLFELALSKAKKRVVVKRPLKGDYLGGVQADCQFLGKHTRFDVYLEGGNHVKSR